MKFLQLERCAAVQTAPKFAALHKAHVSSGMFIYVPDGVEVEDPIEVSHWITEDHVVTFPHTLVVTGRNARVSVVDYFQSDASAHGSWTIPVNELVAGLGSQLTYLALQDLSDALLLEQEILPRIQLLGGTTRLLLVTPAALEGVPLSALPVAQGSGGRQGEQGTGTLGWQFDKGVATVPSLGFACVCRALQDKQRLERGGSGEVAGTDGGKSKGLRCAWRVVSVGAPRAVFSASPRTSLPSSAPAMADAASASDPGLW